MDLLYINKNLPTLPLEACGRDQKFVLNFESWLKISV